MPATFDAGHRFSLLRAAAMTISGRRLALVLVHLAALPAGIASAWWSLQRVEAFGSAAGPWRVSLLAGSADADLHTRARVALGGLLALSRDETLYYVARSDSNGAPLRSRCSYRVRGAAPPARWWSVTAYAEDFFLFPDAPGRYSVNGAHATLGGDGHFTFVSGPTVPERADGVRWLPTPGDRGLVFTLRLYQPAAALRDAPSALAAPRIERIGDCP
jgi:hypothetical protein